ncbi:MAG: LamG domain-containing protein [Nanoarchaeota archaeon]|nr:LamG domain-containing protein [Nanoarchaeota archaeon]
MSNSNWGVSRSSPSLKVYDGDTIVDSTYDLTADIWQHVAVVWDPTADGFYTYLNGVGLFSASTLTYSTNDVDLVIGGGTGASSSTEGFDGWIDEVMVFNRSLTPNQIYAFYQNKTNVIVWTETKLNQKWTVKAYPNDGYEEGLSVTSLNLTVLGNNVPVIDIFIVNSTDANNYTNGSLQVYNETSDLDDDAHHVVMDWYKDGVYQASLVNESTISSGNTSKGQNWTVVVAIFDGENWGANKTGSVIIRNAPPTQGMPKINASSVGNLTTDNITVFNQSTVDADGDSVKNIYQWYKNGVPFSILNLPFEGGSNNITTKEYGGLRKGTGYVNINISGDATWLSKGGYDGGGGYEFDGDNDFIHINKGLTYNDTTVCGWINPDIVSGQREIFWSARYSDQLTLRINANYLKIADGNSERVQSNGIILVDKWSHFCYTFKTWGAGNGNYTFYLNGTYDKSSIATYNPYIDDRNKTLIGIGYDEISRDFDGTIDDILVFNESLSPEQIYLIYSNKTNIIHSSMTNVNNIWKVSVIPNDGYADGNIFNVSLTVLGISNAVPVIDIFIVNSTDANNYTNGSLQVYNVTSDLDGDAHHVVMDWYKDGVYQAGLVNESTISSGNTSKGQNWTVVVAVFDGENWGANKTGSVIIRNAVPVIDIFIVNSTDANNYTNGSLQVYNETSDLDDDAHHVVIDWYKDGVYQSSLVNESLVHYGNTSKNENWTVVVAVYDGDSWGTNKTGSVIIRNAVPVIDIFIVNSTDANNYTNGSLQLYYEAIDLDGDTLSPLINWYRNETLNTTFTNLTIIGSGNTTIFQNWTAVMYVYDGQNKSLNKTGSVIIANNVTVVVTPLPVVVDGGTVGGSGGGGSIAGASFGPFFAPFFAKENFTLEPEEFIFKLAYEESKKEVLVIKNELSTVQTFKLEVNNLDSVLSLSETEFELKPKESKEVIIYAVSDREMGLHVGSIIVKSNKEERKVPVVVEIYSQLVLFDVGLFIPKSFKEVYPGGTLKTEVSLFNVGSPRVVDVLLNYRILDLDGNLIYEESETRAVQGQISFSKEFYLSSELEEGTYVLGVEVVYVDSVAVASSMFNVVLPGTRKSFFESNFMTISLILLLLLIVIVYGIRIIFKKRNEE